MRYLPFCVLALSIAALVAIFAFTSGDAKQRAIEKQADTKVKFTLAKLQELMNSGKEHAVVAFIESAVESGEASVEMLVAAGDAAFESGHIGLAEKCLRQALEQYPDVTTSRLKLANLLFCTGRVFEAREFMVELLISGGLDLLTLPMLGNSTLTFETDTQAIMKSRNHPKDVNGKLAVAYRHLQDREVSAALDILRPEIESGTATDLAKRLWVRCLKLNGQTNELVEWFATSQFRLKVETPDYFCIQGDICRSVSQIPQAVHCFLHAFELDRNSYYACSQLSEILAQEGRTDAAEKFRRRATLIRDFESICQTIHGSDELPTEQQLRTVIQVCRDLGCRRESLVWCSVARSVLPDETWMIGVAQQLQAEIPSNERRFQELAESVLLPVADYPAPIWSDAQQSVSTKTLVSTQRNIQFRDDASIAGIDFVYVNGQQEGSKERRFFDFTGGGVVVIDIDGDGYPDLFFSQGGYAPDLGRPAGQPEDSNRPPDHLYRNLRGEKFTEVAATAGAFDTGYSQGCTSGDINNDGFPDLYVANIGGNQLFLNNGDGTFSPQTVTAEDRWTTSCAIADITGDGIPDIYDVNHIVAAGVYQKMCFEGDVAMPCDLTHMLAAQDCLLAGDGSGQFQDVSKEWGIVRDEGIGLGLIVADLDRSGTLDVFVANDARPNFFFVREADVQAFREEALQRGLALNAEGKSQACMGIAVGDLNLDNRLDLFVTNFFADYNTVYRQEASCFFHDATADTKLLLPAYNSLGFGTQFLDADGDGDLDIVVTNGDVADFHAVNPDRPYRQTSQFFRNDGGGTFVEISDRAGDYFQRAVLGRGLARLDWNVDGKPDFVTSHMGAVASLVTNITTAGESASLQLIGTNSTRDAVGTTIWAGSGDQRVQQQFYTGDGYMAKNQSLVQFSTGHEGEIKHLEVKWQRGATERFEAPNAVSRSILLESRGLYEIPF